MEPTETPVSEPTATPSEVPSEQPAVTTDNSAESPAPTAAPTPTPTPIPTSTPAPTMTAVPLGYGDDLAFSGSITLPSGLTIQTLNKFNYAGMPTCAGNSWMGDIYSETVAINYEDMADNFDAFNAMYSDSAINVVNGEQIWWRSSMANMSPSIEIRKCDDHYKLIISGPYLDLAAAQSAGWPGIDAYKVAMSKEALTVLLSAVSSQPQVVQETILKDLFTEVCISDSSYTTVGDCSIMISEWDFENGNFIVVYNIRSK